MAAMESFIGELGADVVKVAALAGNHRAARFYQSLGFAEGEQVLYRHLDGPPGQ